MSDNLASAALPSALGPRRAGGPTLERGGSSSVPAFYTLVVAVLGATVSLLSSGPIVVLTVGMATALVAAVVLQLPLAHLSRGLVLVAAAGLLEADLSALHPGARLWGIAAIAVCLLVFLLVPVRSLPTFPLLHLFCLVQAMYLFVSVLVARRPPAYEDRFSDQMRADGFALMLVFMGVLSLTGVVATRLFTAKRSQHVVKEFTFSGRASATLVLGTLASIGLGLSSLEPRLGALAQLVRLVPLLGGLALVDLWLRHALELRFKTLLLGAATAYALAGVGTGLLYAAAGPFIATLALVIARRRRLPWAVLLTVVVSVVLLNAGKAEFRQQYQLGSPGGGIARGPAYIAIAARTVGDLDPITIAESAYRFSSSDVLGYLRHHVPNRYPYWDKRTYTALPFALVPRVILPSKPRLDFSNEFGRQYGILDLSDYVTSANIPLPIEAYVNFGMPGLVAVASMGGIFLAWVGSLTSARRTSDVILAALIATQAVAAIESGVTALPLVVPFFFLLRPVARWLVPAVPPASDTGPDVRPTA